MQLKIIMLLGIALVVSGLVSSTYYYKSKYEASLSVVLAEKQKIANLTKEKESLMKQAKETKREVEGYVQALDKMAVHTAEMSEKLQASREKLAKHKLSNMRNSRHSEMVLKIINRSAIKQNKLWMNGPQPPKPTPKSKEAKS